MNLYPGGTILPLEDYEIILDHAKGCKTVLEFGPGVTTLALIEAGVEKIHTYEYQRRWYIDALRRFKKYPQVHVRPYTSAAQLSLPNALPHYDLAVVDSPVAGKHWKQIPGQNGYARLNTLAEAIKRSWIVLLHDAKRQGERKSLEKLADQGYRYEILDTRKGMAVITW